MSNKIKALGTVKILEIAGSELQPQTRFHMNYEADALLNSSESGTDLKIFAAEYSPEDVSQVITEDLEQIAELCLKRDAEYFRIRFDR